MSFDGAAILKVGFSNTHAMHDVDWWKLTFTVTARLVSNGCVQRSMNGHGGGHTSGAHTWHATTFSVILTGAPGAEEAKPGIN